MTVSEQTHKKTVSLTSVFGHWEVQLVLLILIVGAVCSFLSPYFLDVDNLFGTTANFMEKSIMALPMAFIIITIGSVDLSVASNLAMSAIVMGLAYEMKMPIWVAVVIGLAAGTLGGFINGILIGRVKLPALIASLGTYSLYRGLASSLLGDKAVKGFPKEFLALGQGTIGDSPVPIQLVIFLVLAVIFGLVLHRTTFGRSLYAIGQNEEACRCSGLAVDRIKIILFTLSGFMAAFAGMILSARFGSIRSDIANGFELDVITAVVLGGVDIGGGSGSILGVVLALFLLGIVRFGMSLLNVQGQVQSIVVGSLLVMAILVPYVIRQVRARAKS